MNLNDFHIYCLPESLKFIANEKLFKDIKYEMNNYIKESKSK